MILTPCTILVLPLLEVMRILKKTGKLQYFLKEVHLVHLVYCITFRLSDESCLPLIKFYSSWKSLIKNKINIVLSFQSSEAFNGLKVNESKKLFLDFSIKNVMFKFWAHFFIHFCAHKVNHSFTPSGKKILQMPFERKKILFKSTSIFHEPFLLDFHWMWKQLCQKTLQQPIKLNNSGRSWVSIERFRLCLLTAENCFHIFQARLVNCSGNLPFFSRVAAPNPILFCWQPCLTHYLCENHSRTGRCK